MFEDCVSCVQRSNPGVSSYGQYFAHNILTVAGDFRPPCHCKNTKKHIFFKKLKKVKKTVDTSHKPLYNSKASCGTEEFLRRTTVMGSQLSWESICLTSRGSQVRALQVPCYKRIWRDSSVGQSTRFIPVVSRVRIPLSLFIWDLSSAGRASALQAEGHRFEPYRSHFLLYMPMWLNWQSS